MTCFPKVIRHRFILLVFLSLFLTLSFSEAVADDSDASARPAAKVSDHHPDLLRVYQLAKQNDPTFQNERYLYQTSPEILKQARSGLLPSIGMDLYYSHTKQKIHNTDVAVYGEDQANFPSQGYTLELNQPVFAWATFKRYAQAKAEVQQAELEFQAAGLDLFLRVADAYIVALAARDNLDFTRAEEEDLKFHFELARERYNSGLAPVLDFHDAKARYAYVTAKRVKAAYELDDALEALAEMAGERVGRLARLASTVAAMAPDIPMPTREEKAGEMALEPAIETVPLADPDPDDIDAWVDAALEQNFQVRIENQRVRVAEKEIERQRGGHFPTLSLIARTSRDDTRGSLFGGSSDIEKHEALVQLNVPFFEGGRVCSQTREALKQCAAAKEELEKARRAVKRETMAAFLGVKGAIQNTIALSQSVVSTQIALKTKREGFEAGLFPSMVVSDAERDHYQSRRDFAKAQYEYIQNCLRLKKAVGTLSEADLVEINQWLQ